MCAPNAVPRSMATNAIIAELNINERRINHANK